MNQTLFENLKEKTKNKLDIKNDSELSSIYTLLNQIVNDPESIQMFSTNHLVKFYTLDTIINLIESGRDDEYLKKYFILLDRFLAIDYDVENKRFINTSLIPLYGSMLFRLPTFLSDLAINESFKSDEPSSMIHFQSHFLGIINYMLKTVDIRSIILLGFKAKHLQFLIYHFNKSYMLIEILLSVSENLLGSVNLFNAKNNLPNDQLDSICFDVHIILIKSVNIILSLHLNNYKTIRTIKIICDNSSQFTKQNLSVNQNRNERQKIVKTIQVLLKDLYGKLHEESESKYRCMRYTQINVFLYLILLHFDNVEDMPEWKLRLSNRLMHDMNRILSRIAQHQAFRGLFKTEIYTRNLCFSIVIKIMNYFKEDFFLNHMQFKSQKTYFEQTWLCAIRNNNEMAVMALMKLLRIISKNHGIVIEFIIKILKIIDQNINLNNESNIEVLTLNLRMLMSIANFCSHNLIKVVIKSNLIPVINKAITKLNHESRLSVINLNLYIQFISKIIEHSFTKRMRPTGLFRDHVLKCVEAFHDILNFDFDFKIEKKTYILCLDLIRIIDKYFKIDKAIMDFNSIYHEILIQIEYSLDVDSTEYDVDIGDIKALKQTFKLN